MRAKFKVDELRADYDKTFTVVMSAVTTGSEENKDFSKYTPSGSFEMFVDNPKANGFFKVDKEYYLDFTEVGD